MGRHARHALPLITLLIGLALAGCAGGNPTPATATPPALSSAATPTLQASAPTFPPATPTALATATPAGPPATATIAPPNPSPTPPPSPAATSAPTIPPQIADVTPAAPVIPPVFQQVAPRLTGQTLVPVRLPTVIPGAADGPSLHASIEAADDDTYTVELSFAPDCGGATACHLGRVSGVRLAPGAPPPGGQSVALAGNRGGRFTPAECGASCGNASLVWDEDGARYTVELKAGSQEALVEMANSAIANGVIESPGA